MKDSYACALEFHKHGDFDKALEYFEKAIHEEPDSPEIFRDYGLLLIDVERYEEALDALNRSLTIKRDPFSLFLKAKALYSLGDLQQSEELFLEVKPLLKGAVNVSAVLGDLYIDAENYPRAIEEYKESIGEDPFSPHLYNNLALSYFQNGELDKAIETIRTAISIDPDNAELYDNLGVMLYEAGEKSESIEALSKAIELDPDFSQAHCDLCLVYYDLEHLEEAAEEIRKAIALAPDDPVYRAILSNIFLKMGKIEEAKHEMDKLKDLLKPDE
ncbi:MAG TPA: tetratricopeptide repeat protein [Candidatus Hydrothermia bacterium]|nr:tetratricopeptide repeat protein [Candidatus Hydrothermae bacterium]MDD3648544.1 tetratricopeptide repeat protein [Candidatus Hydrothermia bacterium]MDD5572715.1 tetratricopeptide repeat protein [Candidatus Hydrothermia bacterium]HOK22596.1 tetratricopeptide repeat protein [Candidatus Hydrothermia bacterium]HOL23303.1 tetratricopeptide repeat protein [Candidatus Hydrothermia bacterium]